MFLPPPLPSSSVHPSPPPRSKLHTSLTMPAVPLHGHFAITQTHTRSKWMAVLPSFVIQEGRDQGVSLSDDGVFLTLWLKMQKDAA